MSRWLKNISLCGQYSTRGDQALILLVKNIFCFIGYILLNIHISGHLKLYLSPRKIIVLPIEDCLLFIWIAQLSPSPSSSGAELALFLAYPTTHLPTQLVYLFPFIKYHSLYISLALPLYLDAVLGWKEAAPSLWAQSKSLCFGIQRLGKRSTASELIQITLLNCCPLPLPHINVEMHGCACGVWWYRIYGGAGFNSGGDA